MSSGGNIQSTDFSPPEEPVQDEDQTGNGLSRPVVLSQVTYAEWKAGFDENRRKAVVVNAETPVQQSPERSKAYR